MTPSPLTRHSLDLPDLEITDPALALSLHHPCLGWVLCIPVALCAKPSNGIIILYCDWLIPCLSASWDGKLFEGSDCPLFIVGPTGHSINMCWVNEKHWERWAFWESECDVFILLYASIDAEKALGKIQYSWLKKKNSKKNQNREDLLNLIEYLQLQKSYRWHFI